MSFKSTSASIPGIDLAKTHGRSATSMSNAILTSMVSRWNEDRAKERLKASALCGSSILLGQDERFQADNPQFANDDIADDCPPIDFERDADSDSDQESDEERELFIW